MKTTAIVILNYNGKNHLKTFLPSVVENAGNSRIILADNGSTDDSVNFIKEEFTSVELIRSTENLGFAGGYNWALKRIKADYYILLNSDVEVTPNWVSPLIDKLESSDSVVACQPKILSYSNKNSFEHAGAAGGFIDQYGYPFCQGRIFDFVEIDQGQYNTSREIFWASGACLAIKSEVFHAIGGFDQDFFAHMEEIDLCWRIKLTGKKIFYVSESSIYHLGGGTLNKTNPRKTYLNYRNNLFMLLKNLPAKRIIPTIFIRLCLDGVAAMRYLSKGEGKNFRAILQSHFAFYTQVSCMLKKRNHTSLVSFVYTKSIVFEYFLNKIKTFDKLKQDNFRL